MIRNVISALLLDVDFYGEVAEDRSLMRQAVAVVVLANTLGGIGSSVATESNMLVGAIAGLVTGVVGWLIWSAVALMVGVRVFGGDSDYAEMLRVIGFAYAPLAIGVVPWLGFIGAAWALFAAVLAIRESMDFSTQRAVATTALGWAVWLAIAITVNGLIELDVFASLPF